MTDEYKEVFELVQKTFYKEDGKMVSQRVNQNFLRNHNLIFLNDFFQDSLSLTETIFRIKNNLLERPKCPCCGKDVVFSKYKKCFNTYCSPKCKNSSPEMKIKNALGVSAALKKLYQEKGEEIKKKRAEKLFEHFGVKTSTPFGIQKIQEICKERVQEKYGVENIFNTQENRDKLKETFRKKSVKIQKEKGYDIEYLENGQILVKNGCEKCGDIIVDKSLFNNRTKENRKFHTILCPKCNPLKNNESSIERIIKDILIKNQIQFNQHERTLIKPLEIDFFNSRFNIGIECNGIFWHSIKYKSENAQQNKFSICSNKGIKLLQFWEDEIIYKAEIIEDIIKSKFNKLQRISAHKCFIDRIKKPESKRFLKKNSLYIEKSDIFVGLFYKNEIVQLIGLNRYKGKITINNCCSKLGIQIFGGLSKILEYIKSKFQPAQIEIFINNDFSDGNSFEKLGFKKKELLPYCFKIDVHDFHERCSDENGNILKCYTSGITRMVLDC